MFKEKKKGEYNAQAKAKQINKEKGMGKHSKGIRFWGVSGKGKGKEKGSMGKMARLRLQLTMLQGINKHLVQQ